MKAFPALLVLLATALCSSALATPQYKGTSVPILPISCLTML